MLKISAASRARRHKSTGGEVANALVCKTSIRRFNPGPVLHIISYLPRFPQAGHTIKHHFKLDCPQNHTGGTGAIQAISLSAGKHPEGETSDRIRLGVPLLRRRKRKEEAQNPNL